MPDSTLFPTILAVFVSCTAPLARAQDGSVDRYRPAAELLYELEFNVDFSNPKYNVARKGTVHYQVETDAAGLRVTSRGLRASRSSRGSYSHSTDMFPIGPLNVVTRASTRTSSIVSVLGETKDVERPNWISGLPIDVGRLAFPQLSDQPQWSADESITLIRNPSSYGFLQLLPVSPVIKPGAAFAYSRRPGDQADSKKVAIAKITRTRVEQSETASTIEENYLLQGTDFDPQVTIEGTGKIIFSRTLGSVDSISRDYKITVTQKNRVITVPVSLRLARLTGDALAEYREQQQAAAAAAQQRQAQLDAMARQIPEVDDREAVIAKLKGDNQEHFEMMVRKLYEKQVENDPELARILYERFFQSGSASYLAKTVITRLDPKLEQSATIADKYDGTFDISLTGDPLTPKTSLRRDQIVCYPQYSSWKAGKYYGSVDEVVVLESIEREPKLLAFKREQCRLPTPLFVDVNADESK
jgi:hypothetical protein